VQSEKMGFAEMVNWGKVFPQSYGNRGVVCVTRTDPHGRRVASVDALMVESYISILL
jgi:hypothetical protein